MVDCGQALRARPLGRRLSRDSNGGESGRVVAPGAVGSVQKDNRLQLCGTLKMKPARTPLDIQLDVNWQVLPEPCQTS